MLTSTLADHLHKAALALGSRLHRPGVTMAISVDDRLAEVSLHWTPVDVCDADLLDRNRITEDSAEAIALALVHVTAGWTVRRRLQPNEHADWLLDDIGAQRSSGPIALEVSGVRGSDPSGSRVREKIHQVQGCEFRRKAVCVVEFGPPKSTLVKVGA